MTRKSILVVLGLVVSLTIAGCDSSKPHVSPPHRVTTGLRGVALAELSCSPKPKAPNRGVVAIGGVQAFLLCRSGPQGAARPPLTVTPNEPQFKRLVSALSVSSAPPTTGACPALSEVQIVLLARTRAGAFQVSIPVDGCGLYQAGAVAAVYGTPAPPVS
jgi:hypothetical protein